MSLFYRRPGIVNVRMVITEEKILSNIDKIQKLINPKSKKQIVQLDDDAYFKDLIDSVKTYLIEYPKKKNFPPSVYKAAYELVEYATNQFEDNTRKIEELIVQREKNIELSVQLKGYLEAVENKDKDWKNQLKEASNYFQEDIVETLGVIGRCKSKTSQNYADALKLINARISNLESNLHIEIDMERIEDRSKALSYIGIEIAEALKYIPAAVNEFDYMESEVIAAAPVSNSIVAQAVEPTQEPTIQTVNEPVNNIVAASVQEPDVQPQFNDLYFEETRFEARPTLWQRFKNSKFYRTVKYIMQIRVVLDYPALPEGRGQDY